MRFPHIIRDWMARTRRDETTGVPSGDPTMQAAFAQARATLDQFLAVFDAPPPDTRTYAVKIRITDADANVAEYFWVTSLERHGDRFRGRIDNAPNSVRSVQQDQVIEFVREDIYDWMYQDDAQQRMMGNFTLRALLTREEPEKAAAIRCAVGLDRD